MPLNREYRVALYAKKNHSSVLATELKVCAAASIMLDFPRIFPYFSKMFDGEEKPAGASHI